MQAYLENNDNSFHWEVFDFHELEEVKLYNLHVVSQNWRDYVWSHQVAVLVPDEVAFDGALLFIAGGSNKDGTPNWKKPDDSTIKLMGMVAEKNKAVTAVIFQVPNQPLYGDLTEDELISLTLHNYRNQKDYTWPLLFPMVKSAVRAMDAIQEFSHETLDQDINRFLVSGGSKRGWTTWLTGAQDSRVEAIAPMVIDMLNMPKSIPYHLEAWGDYSIQIQDYVNLGIAQDVETPDGREIVEMVDPYSYRAKLTMPKLIFNGTNDEYWPVDAIKLYIDEIPGKNCLHYVPNAGHSLGDKKQAIQALNAFFGEILRHRNFPDCSWTIEETEKEIEIHITATVEKLAGVKLWTAESDDRDFRDNEFIATPVELQNPRNLTIQLPYPESGFRAFYVDLIYPDHNGELYSVSTRMFVSDRNKIL